MFQNSPVRFRRGVEWKLHAAFIEGCLFRPYLQRLASDFLPSIKENKAFEAIPFIWTAYSYAEMQPLSTSGLREKIGASLIEHPKHKFFQKLSSISSMTNGMGHGSELVNGDSDPATTVNGYSKNEPTTKGNVFAKRELNSTSIGGLKHEMPTTTTDITSRASQACIRALGETDSISRRGHAYSIRADISASGQIH